MREFMKMRYRIILIIAVSLASIYGILIYSYSHTYSTSKQSLPLALTNSAAEDKHVGESTDLSSTKKLLNRNYEININNFDIENNDVIVFVHIQKTGGSTLERYLSQYIASPYKCLVSKSSGQLKTHCRCKNKHQRTWIYTRCTSQWYCGMHADYARLRQCVPQYMDKKEGKVQRRFLYITYLRDAEKRYLSEWLHVTRGATWVNMKPSCHNTLSSVRNISLCYNGSDWSNVSLKDFLDCPYNPAVNRQTWMLASLDEIGCERLITLPRDELKKELLESAKRNLQGMAFFGLTEYRSESKYILNKAFGLEYVSNTESSTTKTEQNEGVVTEYERENVRELNDMDVELYRYAKQLYMQRFH